MRHSRTFSLSFLGAFTASAALLAYVPGCGGGGGGGGGDTDPPPVLPAANHEQIVLRDRFGTVIQLGSREPYSPRETCGACHDVTAIANGYHFQQGRTTLTGAIDMRDDFYGDGRSFVKSNGMYGKW
jgi:hypothetical protein